MQLPTFDQRPRWLLPVLLVVAHLIGTGTAKLEVHHPLQHHFHASAPSTRPSGCYPFCNRTGPSSSAESIRSTERQRYALATEGTLNYTNPLIGTTGPDPSEYGGMVPSLSLPFASTRLVPMTRENLISGVPYHHNDSSCIGAIVTRQPAIWMGDYGSVALWSGARAEEVRVDVDERRKRFVREEDEFTSVWKYAVRMRGGDDGSDGQQQRQREEEQGAGDEVFMELSGKSRAHMVQFTYPDLSSGAEEDNSRSSQGPAITVQSSRAEWRGGVEIDLKAGQVSGYNTERMDYRLGPNQALDFKGWYVARFEYQLQHDDPAGRWRQGFGLAEDAVTTAESAEFGTIHTNSSGTTLHPRQTARWNDLGVYAYVRFPAATKRVRIRIGMSLISKQQAEFNLDDEIPDGTDIEEVVQQLIDVWRQKTDRIQVEGGSETDKTILYTGMVRASMYPSEHAEVVPPDAWKPRSQRPGFALDSTTSASPPPPGSPSAQPLPHDEPGGAPRRLHYYSAYTSSVHNVPEGQGSQRYQSFSIWDIYRAQWATLILFEPDRVADMVRSMLDIYTESGFLPMWANLAETNIMIGTHADSLIAEAAIKGIRGFDLEKAWEAVYRDATVAPEREAELRFEDREEYTPLEVRAGLSAYQTIGYVPLDGWDESTSRTLDYAYDDFAVSVLAAHLGHHANATYFAKRSRTNWQTVFHPTTHRATARLANGSFFDQPLASPQARQAGFTEGNTWDYTFAVPHDVPGLAAFLLPPVLLALLRRHFQDGHNNISNEPSQHVPYLFSYLGRHAETHRLVRRILRDGYSDRPDGIEGNEDCGQMSSWAIWNAAFGVYPMNPVSGEVVVGGGIAFERVVVEIPARGEGEGERDAPRRLVISAEGVGAGKVCTRGLKVNGVGRDAVVRWSDLVEGGEWVFDMQEEEGEWQV